MSDGHYFSGVLRQIADGVSPTAAAKLAAERGGTQFNIPKRNIPASELARIVGPDDAAAIVKLLGPGKISIPTGTVKGAGGRRRRAADMLRRGKSLKDTALACDLHQRTVEMISRELREADDSQPRLPFDS